jgi:hypothetical protein
MRLAIRGLLVAVPIYGVFVATAYSWMKLPPEDFARHMARLPGPAMMAMPFPPMWARARAGALAIGDSAPDFDLQTVDHASHARLSGYRWKPVVLVFGSYT